MHKGPEHGLVPTLWPGSKYRNENCPHIWSPVTCWSLFLSHVSVPSASVLQCIAWGFSTGINSNLWQYLLKPSKFLPGPPMFHVSWSYSFLILSDLLGQVHSSSQLMSLNHSLVPGGLWMENKQTKPNSPQNYIPTFLKQFQSLPTLFTLYQYNIPDIPQLLMNRAMQRICKLCLWFSWFGISGKEGQCYLFIICEKFCFKKAEVTL